MPSLRHAHDPKLVARMTIVRRPAANPVSLFVHPRPRTVDDLVRRREMVKTWMDATCGCSARPDFMTYLTLTGVRIGVGHFGKKGQEVRRRISGIIICIAARTMSR